MSSILWLCNFLERRRNNNFLVWAETNKFNFSLQVGKRFLKKLISRAGLIYSLRLFLENFLSVILHYIEIVKKKKKTRLNRKELFENLYNYYYYSTRFYLNALFNSFSLMLQSYGLFVDAIERGTPRVMQGCKYQLEGDRWNCDNISKLRHVKIFETETNKLLIFDANVAYDTKTCTGSVRPNIIWWRSVALSLANTFWRGA